jgi:hypothetical protein
MKAVREYGSVIVPEKYLPLLLKLRDEGQVKIRNATPTTTCSRPMIKVGLPFEKRDLRRVLRSMDKTYPEYASTLRQKLFGE